jgi:hypothetical protein
MLPFFVHIAAECGRLLELGQIQMPAGFPAARLNFNCNSKQMLR